MPLALRVSGGWISGSGVGALGCERARAVVVDGPSDGKLPAAAVPPTKRLAALMNERRSSVEDWRIASSITGARLPAGDIKNPAAATEPDLRVGCPRYYLFQPFAPAAHRDEPQSTSQADSSDFCSWPICDLGGCPLFSRCRWVTGHQSAGSLMSTCLSCSREEGAFAHPPATWKRQFQTPTNAICDSLGVTGMLAQFRNIRRLSLSCPTCQAVWSNAGRRRLLCMGLFSIFWVAPLQRPVNPYRLSRLSPRPPSTRRRSAAAPSR
ncbi:hypothetical protein AB7M56_005530 [Bradyrhizobium elkanii]